MRCIRLAAGLLTLILIGCGASDRDVPVSYRTDFTVCGNDPGSLIVRYTIVTEGREPTEESFDVTHEIIDRDSLCWKQTLDLPASQAARLTTSYLPDTGTAPPFLVCEIRVAGRAASWDTSSHPNVPVECADDIP